MVKRKWPETWQVVNPGCMVFEPGSSSEYHTGTWKSQRPIWDNKKCIKCGICYIFCPEGCIHEGADGYFSADMNYCKGCGICVHECWPAAITMVEEG